ncbi:isocitrate lyase/phosphoenolpyruvate mutase family protein [Dactylosporangium fulvum]|uniref:Isocitrate lyase/phosphoenolpyruvate mutase family protein n=1 Tax=Dactylosporangium fulvum TaxID=53359 RepID=A0ABY5VUY1_9ACTN|nr:isocitrate lyase/phosphoenolpyruvate mutase family protein [Dactylosporangium fulvum]UWP80975.1 isocitrate lyase/phosphoenolpyruvate mutase family protein [Dactylosporangium fulvum]
MTDQQTRAARFRSLHTSADPIVLANTWDPASARIVAATGAKAVATTSAGVAWTLGVPDGDVLSRDAALEHLARIVAAVPAGLPVTADIESGFGATPAEVAVTIRGVLAAGAVGVNLEDTVRAGGARLRDIPGQAERIAAARAAADDAGVDLYINARVDTYLRGGGTVEATAERAAAFLAAGATGIFVPGVADAATIAALTAAIPAPLNVLAEPETPSVAELAKLGVARVSLGSWVAEAAYAVVRRAAEEAQSKGTYGALAGSIDFGELNGMMSNG